MYNFKWLKFLVIQATSLLDIYIDVYYKFIRKSTHTHRNTHTAKLKEVKMATLNHSNLERIRALVREAAKSAIKTVLGSFGSEHSDKGAYIRVYHLPNLGESYIGLIELFAAWIGGGANDNKLDKYIIVSVEKAIRLARNTGNPIPFSYLGGHLSSWESRDQMCARFRDKFGGATLVRCLVQELGPDPTHLLFSVSGLTEIGDEAVALLTAINLPWQVNMDDIHGIVAKSGNFLVKRELGY